MKGFCSFPWLDSSFKKKKNYSHNKNITFIVSYISIFAHFKHRRGSCIDLIDGPHVAREMLVRDPWFNEMFSFEDSSGS